MKSETYNVVTHTDGSEFTDPRIIKSSKLEDLRQNVKHITHGNFDTIAFLEFKFPPQPKKKPASDADIMRYLSIALEPRPISVLKEYDPEYPYKGDWLEVGDFFIGKLENGKFSVSTGYETLGGPGYYDPPDFVEIDLGIHENEIEIAKAILMFGIENHLEAIGERLMDEDLERQAAEYYRMEDESNENTQLQDSSPELETSFDQGSRPVGSVPDNN